MSRGLRAFLVILGTIAVVFGLLGVVGGVGSTLGGETSTPSVDSELRFFAAWYVGTGLLLLWAARQPSAKPALLQGVCGVLVLAATGRAISMVTVGRPDDLYVALMVIEYAIAVVLFMWQRAAARSAP